MLKTTIAKLKPHISILAIVTAVALLMGSTPAFANSTQNTVTVVDFWDGNSGTLQIRVGGVSFIAQNTAGTCPHETVDNLKTWQSLAQAALLSGKQLVVDFTPVGSTNCLFELSLLQ